ncbi:MAG: metal-dependent transcriptional regulator [Methanomassiliicoccales archaeon]|nr:metal-dependent transcriptional regulator [Methanomassiliicoccales archaeon]NYT15343.1 metal-dependent transcriptional regulator [Methanomassiliicoccales archaeon]
MVSESTEDYLEAIYVLTRRHQAAKTKDIAQKLKISPASVSEMLGKLSEQGYIHYEKYKGATLTDMGMREGRRVRRRHRLLEKFLTEVLGIKRDKSHEEACRLEHIISDESMKKICQMVQEPSTCRFEKPFEECNDDCEICRGEPTISLSELSEGEEATITYLICEHPGKVRRLISMGFVPGRKVKMEEEIPMGGPLLVMLDECKVALARNFADLIHVRR